MTPTPPDPHEICPPELQHDLVGVHPAALQVLRWFAWEHLPEGPMRDVSRILWLDAYRLAVKIRTGPELTDGLRSLLKAKDALVRATMDVSWG